MHIDALEGDTAQWRFVVDASGYTACVLHSRHLASGGHSHNERQQGTPVKGRGCILGLAYGAFCFATGLASVWLPGAAQLRRILPQPTVRVERTSAPVARRS